MIKDILSKKEKAEFALRLTEAFYTSHVHAGKPCVSVPGAVRMAAIAVGLALSAAVQTLISDAQMNPDEHTKTLDEFAKQLNRGIATDQERLAMRIAAAMQKPASTRADDAPPSGSTPAA